MTEFGIFSDEGKVVGDFYSKEEAEAFSAKNFTADDEVVVAACCHDHPENKAEHCEECDAEEAEEIESEEEEE